jgi:hypothetical protein
MVDVKTMSRTELIEWELKHERDGRCKVTLVAIVDKEVAEAIRNTATLQHLPVVPRLTEGEE